MTTWPELEQQIARWLPRLRSMDTVTFRNGHLFTELQQLPDELTLAAVSNLDLPSDRQLTSEQNAALEQLGWTPPQLPDYPIWHAEIPWPLTTELAQKAAHLLTATLHTVFGAASPQVIEIEAFSAGTAEQIPVPLHLEARQA